MYYIKSIFLIIYDTETNRDLCRDSKRIKIDSIDPTYIWQVALGHIWLEMIKRSIKEGPLKSPQMHLLSICESYLEGKITKRTFTENSTKVTECLEQSDVYEPIKFLS